MNQDRLWPILRLPEEPAAFQATQKMDDQYLTFHGEWSPFSNFHYSLFTIEGQVYHSAEQWILSQKALHFGDTPTANQILRANTPYECKHLGYQINNFDHNKWHTEGYDKCLAVIKEKFLQNPPLLNMLKSTLPRIIVKATLDRLWGTGVQL